MTTQNWTWTLTTGTLLAFSPAALPASEPEVPPQSAAAAPAALPTPQATSVFTSAAPGQPAGAVAAPPPVAPVDATAPAPAPAARVSVPGRPLTWWERCKARNQECWLGFPEYFQAPPVGMSLARHFGAQVANGDAARMVLYHYDFDADGIHLTLRGQDRLGQIVAMLPCNGFPIVIERTPGNPALAERRRQEVLTALAQGPFPIPPERVMIGPPIANGLAGPEAMLVYTNLLSQTAGRGPQVSGSGPGGSGSGTGAGGGIGGGGTGGGGGVGGGGFGGGGSQ